jgi:hypothetical protein
VQQNEYELGGGSGIGISVIAALFLSFFTGSSGREQQGIPTQP